jgi:hypothetical protein
MQSAVLLVELADGARHVVVSVMSWLPQNGQRVSPGIDDAHRAEQA